MIQGTGSQAGKTTVVAGLCRLFARKGLRVAPFKSQNMSLNSFVTVKGEEIARSIAVQAAAARQEPIIHMNPLLLKPKADNCSQLIVHGKSLTDVSSADYFCSDRWQSQKIAAIRESISFLRERYDIIVAEGAGSCAEPNLRSIDVVNMGAAEMLSADVYLLADIDRGGVFASLLGSLRVMELTAPEDVTRVRGFILNKFRGDRSVLQPGIEFIEKQTGIPVVGVLPLLHDLDLEEEDRVKEWTCTEPEIDIAVLYLPHISNATDLDPLRAEHGVQLRYVKTANDLGNPDAIIIPGTKNAVWDLEFIRKVGLESRVKAFAEKSPILGICGGYEMLAQNLFDPDKIESELGTIRGIGLLSIEVYFKRQKTVVNREYSPTPQNPFHLSGIVKGYEIHCGDVELGDCHPLYQFQGGVDGAIHPNKPIMGTFIHDIFSNPTFTRCFINYLRARKNLEPLQTPLPDRFQQAELAYDRLADMLAEHTAF